MSRMSEREYRAAADRDAIIFIAAVADAKGATYKLMRYRDDDFRILPLWGQVWKQRYVGEEMARQHKRFIGRVEAFQRYLVDAGCGELLPILTSCDEVRARAAARARRSPRPPPPARAAARAPLPPCAG